MTAGVAECGGADGIARMTGEKEVRAMAKQGDRYRIRRQMPLHMMLIPGILITLVYAYGPMFGVIMAFQKFEPARGFFGSEWVGLANFQRLFTMPDTKQLIWNTFFISSMKVVANELIPIILALMLNEIVSKSIQRGVQTVLYIPYFMSWVILGGVLRDFLSPSGFLNTMLAQLFGMEPILFLGDKHIFPFTLVVTELWQSAGFNTVVFLAAITAVNPELYEAAAIDGANRWERMLHVTLPAMRPVIVLTATLALGSIFNAGFDQVFTLYNAAVMETGDIIDTWVYRMGLQGQQYSLATAVGLMKSLVSLVLVSGSYFLAYKFSDYRIF